MFSSLYYKTEARQRLKGNYTGALIATLIFILPTYILFLIDYLLTDITGGGTLLTIIEIIFKLFVINIINIGYFKFLSGLNEVSETESEPILKRYDFNTVLTGFTNNFRNTLKITFLKELYILLWGLLAIIPMLVYVGIIAYLFVTTDYIPKIYDTFMQFVNSPSVDMANNLALYIEEHCSFLPITGFIAVLATIACTIPVIYKSYEYSAIPMILADNCNIPAKKAFKMTYDIMHGFRWRFFCIQLSFLGYLILLSLIFAITGSITVYYFAQVLLMPYMSLTLIRFYRSRRKTIDYNISVYGEN